MSTLEATPPPARTTATWSARWATRLQAHAAARGELPWEAGAGLSPAQREALGTSLQEFQLGEGSDGARLLALADATGDPAYAAAVRALVADEQRHSAVVGRFMDLAGVPRLERSWVDDVFRAARGVAGLELMLTVLVTAELAGLSYYAALRRATGSPLLRALCRQVLGDERLHVRFQADALAALRRGRAPLGRALTRLGHHALAGGVLAVVWTRYGPVWRAAGLDARAFSRVAWRRHARWLERATRPTGVP